MLKLEKPVIPPPRPITGISAVSARIDYMAKAATFAVNAIDDQGAIVEQRLLSVRGEDFEALQKAGFGADVIEARLATIYVDAKVADAAAASAEVIA